ncbi:hypothetical protein LTR10_022325 [Elasticomyces elasticus]|nr:hypothetical protein LTR10_022325 [Elasticomyces elasticus]
MFKALAAKIAISGQTRNEMLMTIFFASIMGRTSHRRLRIDLLDPTVTNIRRPIQLRRLSPPPISGIQASPHPIKATLYLIHSPNLSHSPKLSHSLRPKLSRHFTKTKTLSLQPPKSHVSHRSAVGELLVDGRTLTNDSESKGLGRLYGEDDEEDADNDAVGAEDRQDSQNETHHLRPASIDNPESLRRTFMQCIVPESRARVEEALTMYETKDLDGKDYRVHRDISPKLDSFSHDVTRAINIADHVHAIHTPAGWQCKVPQCGATFDHEFTIDLHLWAHGLVAKWYCGEPSCRNGSDQGYIDRQSFKDHVAMEHMSSHYSLATARRTPDKDVLVAGLWRYLKLARVPRTTAVDSNSTIEHTTPSSVDDEMCEVPDNRGDPLWNRSPSRHVADQLARSAKRAQFAQSKRSWRHERLAWQMFRMVYDMEAFEDDLSPSERVVKETRLDQAFKKQNPSRRVYSEYDTSGYWDEELQEYPGKYLTGVLTGGHKTLRAREARLFDKSSRALRDMLGTNDKDVLWTALSQMLQGLPPALELDIDFVDFEEDFNQDSNNRQSTQIDDTEESKARRPDTKLVTVVVCPWPGCECRNIVCGNVLRRDVNIVAILSLTSWNAIDYIAMSVVRFNAVTMVATKFSYKTPRQVGDT